MVRGASTEPVDAGVLLGQILAGAHDDAAQLRALHRAIAGGLALPADVHVVGEPLSLVEVAYDGNPRRGLVARCRRDDGSEHRIAFADVELREGTANHAYLAAYCKWLGVAPVADSPAPAPRAVPRRHKAQEEDLDLSRPVELVVLAVKQRAARCRLLESARVITLRAGNLHRVVGGQIVTVKASKHWRHAGHPYLSGQIVDARIDAAALGLIPLELRPEGDWDPAEEYWGEEGAPIEEWARPIIARGPRPAFEMEQVIPGSDPDDFDSDPILEANDLKDAGDRAGAQALLEKLLEADLRCLDAHAHLGNLVFTHSPQWALAHYEVGTRIGELSLGDAFDGVLPWGLIDNRPFLRCLHGYGLCLWRLGRWEEAERVFDRMLWLNPSDHQGVRSLWPAVRAREPWVDDEARR